MKPKKNKLAVQALLHDLHESVTGDILPMFKSKIVKERRNSIQENILSALKTKENGALAVDLKIIDPVAFYYEIRQMSSNILHQKKLKLAHAIAEKQLSILYAYCAEHKIKKSKIQQFLQVLDI